MNYNTMDLGRILVTLGKKGIELYPFDSIKKEGVIYYSGKEPDAEAVKLIKEYCKNNDIIIKKAGEKEKEKYNEYARNMIL